MLNQLPVSSWRDDKIARQPRGVVVVNGELMVGWVDWTVNNNGYYEADKFTVNFAQSWLPEDRNVNWFSEQQEMFIEVFAGFPADAEQYTTGDLTSLIYGKVDHVRFHPVSGILEASGRDMTGVLVDAKTSESYKNQTSSQIVTAIAATVGLITVDKNGKSTVTETKTKVGVYYKIDNADVTSQKSKWDILVWLAKKERFQLYTKGKELHFCPQQSAIDEPYLLMWDKASDIPTFNGSTLEFERDFTIAKGVSVTVTSWHDVHAKKFTATYPTTPKKKKTTKINAKVEDTKYNFMLPNATQEKCLAFAEAKYKEIVSHEMKLTAELPADNVLDVRKVIKVEGTRTAFDQTYYPSSVDRTMSFNGGYTMSVNAKSHAVDTESPT